MDTKLLEDIGLTKSEALVYLALTELGPSTTGKIVEKSGVASSKIYELLDKLEKKGLASHAIRTGVKEFEAAPPERIMMYLEEKEKELRSEKIRAQKLVSVLKAKKIFVGEQEATIYRGLKGVKTAFYSCTKEMKPGSTVLVMGVPKRHEIYDKFFVRWGKFRKKHNIKLKIMFEEKARGDYQASPAFSPLSEIRFMPEDVISPAAVNVFDDKVIIFPSEKEKDPILILIRSRDIADSFRTQFNLLWRQNVKTFYGLDGPKFVLKDMVREGRPLCAFGLSGEKLQKNVPEELEELVKFEEESNVPPRLIFTSRKNPRIAKNAKVKYLPERFSTPFHYEIYGGKVAIFYWIKPVITTVVEDENVAKQFRQHFEQMWRIGKE